MQANIRIALLIGSSLLLGGCQLLQSKTARLEAGLRIPQQAEPRQYASQQFELGRSSLASRSYVAAITAFRNSALEPEFEAASYNGLGIAYAGIGRNDLASRYFRMAVAIEPDSPRFAGNLARLEEVDRIARQARIDRVKVLPAPAVSPAARVIPGTQARAALEVASPHARFVQSPGIPIRVGADWTAKAKSKAAGSGGEPRQPPRNASRTVAIEGPRSASQFKVAGESRTPHPEMTLPKPAEVPTLAVAKSSAKTVSVPSQWTAHQQSAPAVTTTGRRYSPSQFAEIFEPYAQPEARTPIMASVTSPGLRSNAVPQPAFGSAVSNVAGESLAMADK